MRLEDKGDYVRRVGLCFREEWGSVSDHKINNAAKLVCKQLGLPDHG